MDKQKLKTEIMEIIVSLLYTIILFLGTYVMKYGSIGKSIYVMKHLIINGMINYILVGYLIMFILFIILKSIFKDNFRTNVALTVLTLIITIISYYKFQVLELPFLPSDALLIGNADQIAEFGLTFPPINMIIITIVLVMILVLHYIIRKGYHEKTKMTWKTDFYRVPLFIIGIVMLYFSCIAPERFKNFKLKNDLGDSYSWMGGNGAFFIHLGDLYFPEPEGYSKENIQKIEEEITNSKKDLEKEEKENANVIMIMNESFSNPNKIRGTEYSVNPIKEIESLRAEDKNCIIGMAATPVFGGGTSLPEFEALTGLSSYYLEKQIFPYTSAIRSEMNSLVNVYNSYNYTTIGIHTNTGKFYSREKIYKYLGFEETIFSEDIENPEIKGEYISDNEFANQIIGAFERNKGNKFIFGVTMQNHMPYDGARYKEYDVNIESSNLSDDLKEKLQSYVQGVYDGDKMYKKLVDYLRNINEPTILVMFGDHLPALASIYEELDYSPLEYYSTPYVVWSNYDVDYNELFFDYMSPNNLGISALKLANLETPWFLNKFEELYEKYPAINNQFAIRRDYKIMSPDIVEEEKLISECRILQYDLLIKKKYVSIYK